MLSRPKFALLLLIVFASGRISAGMLDLAPRPLPFPMPAVTYAANGQAHSLAELQGKPYMLWLVSTWCHTCIASLRVMDKANDQLMQQGFTILLLRNHDNDGAPGPDARGFAQQFAPGLSGQANWRFGEASAQMKQALNAKQYPDIYYLVDAHGQVQTVSTAPTVTLDRIRRFAQHAKNMTRKTP